jgi:hypothetical protein
MKLPPTYPIAVATFVLGLACWALGEVFDYTEWKYGKPPLLPLRWKFIGVLASIVIMVGGIVVLLFDHYR